ncbi:hypothetical protein IFR05_003434 [Cadophora sp. M221]|nr:hypothetical protein IFR05_003434 [Cadophora sp. M221]
MGQQTGKVTSETDPHPDTTNASHNDNIKTLYSLDHILYKRTVADTSDRRLPYGIRPDNYEEFGFPYLPIEDGPHDDKLIVIRRDSPHVTAKGRGLISLQKLRNSQLCAVCKGIEVLGLDCHFELVHLPVSKLRDNSTTCVLCSLLYSALRQSYYTNPSAAKFWLENKTSTASDQISEVISTNENTRRNSAYTSILTWPKIDETSFHVFLGYEGTDTGSCIFRIFKQPIPQLAIPPYATSRATITKRKFEAIYYWLAEDVKNLGNLVIDFEGSEGLPTRLIDVGTEEEAEACCSTGNHDEGTLRLIYTKDAKLGHIPLPANGLWELDGFLNPNWIYYAALSHRWGKSTEVSSTTKQNIQSRFNGIAYSDLCGTFQDAIIVARQLRIRYLWIDSLCIIQDDKDDWRRESAVMGDVYYKSFVTFFAHSYADEPSNSSYPIPSPKNGLNIDSNDEIRTKDQLEEDGGSGFLESALCMEQDRSVFLGSTTPTPGEEEISLYARISRIFEDDIQNSSLTRRAWIVQERLLSPRIIHFFPSQLYYESYWNSHVRAEDTTMPPTFDKFRECISNTQTWYGATPDMWFKVVERFCSCHLTQGSDKLLAIGGIAQKFHNESQAPYWAGLFADRAAKGLLWIRRGPKLVRVQGRAPSWSWASVDGPIRYSDVLTERPFKILPEVMIDYSLTNPLDEPKHLNGFDNVFFLLGRGFMRNISISSEYSSFKDIVGYSPVPNKLPFELDIDDTYRNLLDDQGTAIGWVALDEDHGDNLPNLKLNYTSLIVASEEAWVKNPPATLHDSHNLPLYRTHPPSHEFAAFATTNECTAEYTRLNSDDEILPESKISRSVGKMVLHKTYWVLILRPENAPLDVYTPAEERDELVVWKRVGMGLVFEKSWVRQRDRREFYFG